MAELVDLQGHPSDTRLLRPSVERFERARSRLELVFRAHGAAIYGVARYLCGPELADRATITPFTRLWEDPDVEPCDGGNLRLTLLALCIEECTTASGGGRSDPSETTLSGGFECTGGGERPRRRSRHALEPPVSVGGGERMVLALALFGKCSCADIEAILDIDHTTVNRLLRGALLMSAASIRASADGRSGSEQ